MQIPKQRLSDYVARNLYVKSKPFTFRGRPYLYAPYDTQHKDVIYKFARQCEKSTMLANKAIAYQVSLAPFHYMYVGPMQEQARNFSNNRFRPAMFDSPHLKDAFFDEKNDDMIDNVFNKRMIGKSEAFFRYAFLDADRCRGYSVDLLEVDELQDILSDHLPVIEECLSHSNFKIRAYSGTPKSFDNPMEKTWRDSTMNEWCIKCDHCSKWQRITIKNIGLQGPICAKCGHAVRVDNGQWVSFNRGAQWDGYHVSHIMVPWVDWHEILTKRENYDEGTFMNEVMGESHDLLEKVLTEGDMQRCCDERRGQFAMPPDLYRNRNMFAGVDWGKGEGKGYTVLTIGSKVMNNPNMVAVWYMKKYKGIEADPLVQIDDICKHVNRFNCSLVGCDHGFGFTNNRILREKLGRNKILEFQSVHSTKGGILKYDGATERYSMNRTKACADMILRVKRRQMSFPRWAVTSEFSEDFTCIYEDYSPKARMFYYDHPPDMPDDSFFSALYLTQAIGVYEGMPVTA